MPVGWRMKRAEKWVMVLSSCSMGVAFMVWPRSGPLGELLSPGCTAVMDTAVMRDVPYFCCQGGNARSAWLLLTCFALHVAQSFFESWGWRGVALRVPLNCGAVGAAVCSMSRWLGWCSVPCSEGSYNATQ